MMANEGQTKWMSEKEQETLCVGDCEQTSVGCTPLLTSKTQEALPREAKMKMDGRQQQQQQQRVSIEKVSTTTSTPTATATLATAAQATTATKTTTTTTTTCSSRPSQHQNRRPALRKQGSGSHRLDSCASSDSGQGTNSSGSLAACSSLVSVVGCSEPVAGCNELPPSSSASASASPSSSSSSSSSNSSSSSSCNSSSSASSSSSFTSSSCCGVSSSSASSSPQQQLVLAERQQERAALDEASRKVFRQIAEEVSDVAGAACLSGARRRQSWLMSFGGDLNAARILAATTTAAAAPTTVTAASCQSVPDFNAENNSTDDYGDGDNNNNKQDVALAKSKCDASEVSQPLLALQCCGDKGDGELSHCLGQKSDQNQAANDCTNDGDGDPDELDSIERPELSDSELELELGFEQEARLGSVELGSEPALDVRPTKVCNAQNFASSGEAANQAKSRIQPKSTKPSKRREASTGKTCSKQRARASGARRRVAGAQKSLVIGGRLKRVQFFPLGPTGATPEVGYCCGRERAASSQKICADRDGESESESESARTTVGHLVLCLEVNERERRQLLESKLIRQKLGLRASNSSGSSSNSGTTSNSENEGEPDFGVPKQLPACHFWRLVASESDEDDLTVPPERTDNAICPLLRLIQAADQDPNNRPQLLLLDQEAESNYSHQEQSASLLRSAGEQQQQQQQQQQQKQSGRVPRLNSIDEEEVCLTTQLNSSTAELEFNYSSPSSSSGDDFIASNSSSPTSTTTTTTTTDNSELDELGSVTSLFASSLLCLKLSDDEEDLDDSSNGLLMQQQQQQQQRETYAASAERPSLGNEKMVSSRASARAAELPRLDRFVAGSSNGASGSVVAGTRWRSNELQASKGDVSIGDNGRETKVSQEEIRDEPVAAKEASAEEMNVKTLETEDNNDNEEDAGDDDDDYFYDDELAFASGQPSSSSSRFQQTTEGRIRGSGEPHPGSVVNSATSVFDATNRQARKRRDSNLSLNTTNCSIAGDTASMSPISPTQLAQQQSTRQAPASSSRQLVACGSVRPLLVWTPSVRRTSCPVGGQIASFASWRQLWPPTFDSANGVQIGCSFVCNQCLRTVPQHQPQPSTNVEDQQALMRLIQMQQQQQQRPVSPSFADSSSCRERKASQHSLFSVRTSDYFSSFDQPDPPTYTNPNGSWLSVQQEELPFSSSAVQQQRQRIGQRALVQPSSNLLAGSCRTNTSSNRTEPSSTVNELRRQSTITGFDHYKYQAPRSPSLCLPGARPGRLQRNNNNGISSSNCKPYLLSAQQTQQRLSPTHSTGGSSSPSPTHWHQHQAALLLSGAAVQQANHQQQSMHQQQAFNNQSQQRGSLRGFARARLESLESDRGSSPSWSASTSSLRSTGSIYSLQRKFSGCCAPATCAPGNWCQQCCPVLRQDKFRPKLPNFCGKQPPMDESMNNNNNSNPLLNPYNQHNPLLPSPSQQVVVAPQQQQQAVYFFLCCCQRRNSPSADPSEQQQAEDEAQAQAQAETEPAGEENLSGTNQATRRVSLVARPAIVGAYDSSGNLRPSQSQRSQSGAAGTLPAPAPAAAPSMQLRESSLVGEEGVVMSNIASSVVGDCAGQALPAPASAEGATVSLSQSEWSQQAKDGEETGPKIDSTREDDGDLASIGNQLKSLLEKLDVIQRQAAVASQRPLAASRTAAATTTTTTSGWAEQRVAERQLIEAIKQRVLETERLLTMGISVLPSSPRAAGDLMRYSTPNLLVSSNFEHIMRLREKRAKEEATEESADGREPPEATEAWFLSRSPAAGGSRSGSAASGTNGRPMAQRQLSRESIRSARNVTDARTTVRIVDSEQQERARRRFSVQPSSGTGHEDLARGGAGFTANANVSNRVEQQTTTTTTSTLEQGPALTDQRVGVAATITGDHEQQPQQQTFAATKPTQSGAAAGVYCPLVLSQVSGFVHDKSMAQARYLYSTLTSNTTALLCASTAASTSSSSVAAAAAATTTGPSNSTTTTTAPSVANTSNSTANNSTNVSNNNKGSRTLSGGQVKGASLAAGQSPSPTRLHGIQRKQAQFVADRHSHQQQHHRSFLASGVAATIQQRTQSAGAAAAPATTVAMQARGAIKEVELPRVAEGEAARDMPTGDKARVADEPCAGSSRPAVTRAQVSGAPHPDGGDSDNDSDSNSDSGSFAAHRKSSSSSPGASDDELGADERIWRQHQHRMDRSSTKEDDEVGDEDDARERDANVDANKLFRQQASRQETPSIVESQYDPATSRRQSQGSRQTSRSNSVITGTDTPTLVSQHSTGQLQPSAMDPAMHALWAQGADLDTGNGNFIMATRRRRSVHALHQVHQIQQQQQLQGKQHFQPSRSFASASSGAGIGALAEQVSGSSSQYKCYKIAERHAGRRRAPPASSQEGWASDEQYPASRTSGSSTPGGASSSASVQQRNLKSELRKLRATSSIDETARGGTHRARFVSAPTPAQRISPSATTSTLIYSDETGEIHLEDEEVDDVREDEHGEESEAGAAVAEKVKLEQKEEEEALDDEIAEDLDKQRMFYLEDAEYDLDELESSSSMLANLYDWNYPIFELSDRYGNSILSKLSYRIFFDSGFFDSFKIPKQAFFNFFHALEDGYHHKPYHNRLHAADVLHAVYYLTSQPIDNFCQVPLDLIEHYDELLNSTRQVNPIDRMRATNHSAGNQQQQQVVELGEDFVSKLHNHIVAVVVAAAAAADDSELPFGIMGANLTALEVMALYTAAAMHDFQHPGRTNSFLVATSSPLALLYNDRSVLESHHSAAAWALFYSGPGFNWLCNLEKDEFKRFRFMIIELILATDLMRHYELVSAFNKKLNNVGRHNIDWFCESDRLLVMEIIIKLADVNGPMKGHQLHCQWTDRIAMEFYEQGDEERALNLPVSLYMDRSDPRLPELQKSFINHLVGPLSHSYAAAGFFPRSNDPSITELDQDDSSNVTSAEFESEERSVYNQSKYWLIDDQNGSDLNKQFLRCTQTLNLRNNFLYWDAKSKEKQVTSTNESNQSIEAEGGE